VLAGEVVISMGGTQLGSVPISASGTSNIAKSGGFLTFTGTGSASFSLDPSLFIAPSVMSPLGYNFVLRNQDAGFRNGSLDTTLDSPFSFEVSRLPSRCAVGFGDELCNNVGYQLTYEYTPTGAIPEPATWAMMIGGFCLIGATLRRRSTKSALLT
jgi:hypothetical protein